MPLHAQLGHWEARGRRRAERAHAHVTAGLRKLGVTGRPVTVHDLSTHGFCAEVDPPLPPGTFVWLRFAGANGLNARVVWRDGALHGCEFLAPISDAMQAAVLG